jgi:large subunit ribosomal protein L35
MPKNKPNKGLLKRIRITKSGRVKIGRAGGRHKRSHKTGKLLRSYRKNTYVSSSDMGRIRAMLFRSVGNSSAAKTASTETTNES